MTRPIETFDNLTSEISPAGGNVSKHVLTLNDRQYYEQRARYERAEMMANALGDLGLWVGRQYRRLVDAVRGDLKLRAAEAQLHRMTDRELADLGLTRADIAFAVREAVGEAPLVDTTGAPAVAANGNLRRAA